MRRRELQTDCTPERGNALQACVASILDLPLAATPNFIAASGGDYWNAMLEHAATLQLSLLKVALDSLGQLPYPTSEGSLCILRGTSPRGGHGHVVVASVAADGRSLVPVYDPHPNGSFLAPPLAWAAFYVAMSPAAVASNALTMAAKPEQQAISVCEELRSQLAAAGFTLQAPFLVRWYNEHPKIAPLPAVHKLDGGGDAVALLIGNSAELWDPFVKWIGQRLSQDEHWLSTHPDALDAYTEKIIRAAVAQLPSSLHAHVCYAFETLETHGRCASVATVAHVAGLAYYEPEIERSLHPTLGPWIAYRAVVVFSGLAAPLLTAPAPLRNPLPIPELRRVAEIQKECFAKWDDADEPSNWKRLREIVDAFEFGDEHRYEEAMLQFHYEPNAERRNRILRDAVVSRVTTAAAVQEKEPPHALQLQQAETQTAHALAQQVETQTLLSPGQQAETQTFLATGEESTQTLAAASVADASVQHRPVLATLA